MFYLFILFICYIIIIYHVYIISCPEIWILLQWINNAVIIMIYNYNILKYQGWCSGFQMQPLYDFAAERGIYWFFSCNLSKNKYQEMRLVGSLVILNYLEKYLMWIEGIFVEVSTVFLNSKIIYFGIVGYHFACGGHFP